MSERASSPIRRTRRPPGVGLGHLFARVALVEDRVRALVEHRRRDDPAPDDPFRGLYLNDDDVDRLLAARDARRRRATTRSSAAGRSTGEAAGQSRLRALQRGRGLTDLDVELLLAALVPDLDTRFERLYGYLNDDVTRRRASVGLALELAGASTDVGRRPRRGWSRAGRWCGTGCVIVEDPDRPLLTRGLRVPDRVAAHLLGDDAPGPALARRSPRCCRTPRRAGRSS